jgi:hypothetical protein
MLKVRNIWLVVIALTVAWLLYVAFNAASFQNCLAGKQNQQSLSGLSRIIVVNAQIYTDCFFVFLYDSRDAATAVATAFIAIFTLTLWWATWGLRTHGREAERAYVSGGGPLVEGHPNLLAFTVDNYGKTPAVLLGYAIEFCPLNAIPPVPLYNIAGYARRSFHNRIRPDTMGRVIAGIPIPDIPRPMLAYGRYWFLDIWKVRHSAGFVLVIEADRTHGYVPPGIPSAYTDWN